MRGPWEKTFRDKGFRVSGITGGKNRPQSARGLNWTGAIHVVIGEKERRPELSRWRDRVHGGLRRRPVMKS